MPVSAVDIAGANVQNAQDRVKELEHRVEQLEAAVREVMDLADTKLPADIHHAWQHYPETT